MPATVAGVRVFLGLASGRPVDDDALAAAVAGANDAVSALRSDCPAAGTDGEDPPTWPPRCEQAATIYAARLYGRRSSVQGIAAFQDAGVQLLASDPDVALLLQLGRYQNSVTA
jgi:hypothetical protein